MAIVKSLGTGVEGSEGWKGELAVCRPNKLATTVGLGPGLWAMLRAAVAVSGALTPLLVALEKSVEHCVEPGPVELTHAAIMLARVLISCCGTVPLSAGVVTSATLLLTSSRLARVLAALLRPVAARAVLELETCRGALASLAK